jgi:uncharacterized repeat protein (TIGR03803 family)
MIRILIALSAAVFSISAQAQTVTVLYNFSGGSDGGVPSSNLVFDRSGNLYGATQYGGLGYGTVFELSPNGNGGWNESVLYSFAGGADGSYPLGSLILDKAGNVYGTAIDGGANFAGVLFRLSRSGANWNQTVLYNFCSQSNCTDGANPFGNLVRDKAGNLYGTTNNNNYPGVVFELTPSAQGWTEQSIYSVDTSDIPGLTMGASGNIFGSSGTNVFELSPNGQGGWTPMVLHTFAGYPKDGGIPEGAPMLDRHGNIYGTTYDGGADNFGTVYELSPGTNGWIEHILHSFKGTDGQYPYSGVVLGRAGRLYGTSSGGGEFSSGTVYEVGQVANGDFHENVLVNFNATNGYQPTASLIADSTGNLYGTTQSGGSVGSGVVFEVKH